MTHATSFFRQDTHAAASGARLFLAGNVLLGTIGVCVHQAQADALTTTWFRCAFGLLGLTVWLALRGQLGALRLRRDTAPVVLGAGALMVLSWALFFWALAHIPTGVAVVLFHVQPLWVLALAALWLREPVGRRALLSVGLAMVGLVLATGLLPALTPADGGAHALGVAACLAGALCTAMVTLMARRLGGLPAGVLAWWQCALGTLVLVAAPVLQGWPVWGVSWGWLAGLGLVHTALAYGLLYAGMARLPVARVAAFQFVYPAVAIALDSLVLGRHLGPLQLAGVALMAAAIVGGERRGR